MRLQRSTFLILCCTLLTACVHSPEQPTPTPTHQISFEKTTFQQIAPSSEQEWTQALQAFQVSCSVLEKQTLWEKVCHKALHESYSSATQFFHEQFTPWTIAIDSLLDDKLIERKYTGLTTGYYEPLLYGSRSQDQQFCYPIYRTPDDLIQVDLDKIYPQLKGLRLRGKIEGNRLVPYDTRARIQKRTDMDRWAIAYVNDPIALFFLHIQGSGRILLPDGSYMRVGFADQNGYKYQSIGNWLVTNGHLARHELSMQRIQKWAQENPSLVPEALAQNPSYVFFRERFDNADRGPIGAQGLPLTPQASIAVDTRHWKLGTPFIIQVEQKNPSLSFTRPVIAQDTGSAIKGPIRFDYFWGFGDEAGQSAGRQKSTTKAWVLLPNGVTPEQINNTP